MGAILVAATIVSAASGSSGDALALLAAGEPTCLEVQAAAERAAAAEPSRSATWLARASHAAWAPRLDTGWQHSDLEITRMRVGAEPTLAALGGNRYGVRLTWDLPRAIFDLGEVRAALSTAELARLAAAVKREAARVYFQRQRRRLELLTAPSASPVERARRQLEIDASAATLDALTAGFFTRRLRALSDGAPPAEPLSASPAEARAPADDADDTNTLEEDDE